MTVQHTLSLLVLASLGMGCVEQGRVANHKDYGPIPSAFDSTSPGTEASRPPSDGQTSQYDAQQPKPDTNSGVQLSAQEQRLLSAINAHRQSKGLSVLTIDPILLCAARRSVQYCCGGGMAHHYNCDDGSAYWGDRIRACGGSSTLANSAAEIGGGPGWNSETALVAGWEKDPPHAKYLDHSGAKKVGVAGSSAGCYFAIFDCCIMSS